MNPFLRPSDEKKFMRSVANFVHFKLDCEEIPHFVHSFPQCSSVVVFVSLISYQSFAEKLLLTHPYAKGSRTGIDKRGDAWIQIYF